MKYKLVIDKDASEEITVVVHAPSPLTRQIEDLVRSYSGEESIIGYRDNEMKILLFREIECITVLDRKVIAIDTNSIHYTLRDRLRDLETILPSYFIRINKSTLANEHRILRFRAVFSGCVNAEFQCGYQEYVSRRCFTQIRKRYERV